MIWPMKRCGTFTEDVALTCETASDAPFLALLPPVAAACAAADQNHELLRQNPWHPSLQLKKVGRFWSVRVGLRYRALVIEHEGELVWVWIGLHGDYDHLVGRR